MVKILRTDNGLEFVNKEVFKYFARLRHTTPHYSSIRQSRIVERENHTIVESVRKMICAKNLDVSLWTEAVNTAIYTHNRTGTSLVKK